MQEADRRKDDFLAMLAHELRNPLAADPQRDRVMQRQAAADPQLTRVRDVIERQVGHLTRLIDDLLDVSRITRGKINLKREPVDVGANRAAARSRPASRLIERARPPADRSSCPSEPLYVDGDLVRLTQVFANLLNNAAKYTPEGGRIELQVQETDGRRRRSPCATTASASTQEYLSHVFELFGQAELRARTTHDGLGIGLALVQAPRRDARRRRRGPQRRREPGQRVRRAPAAPSRHARARPNGKSARRPVAAAISGRRILVVDDSADCRESLAAMLQLDGNEVRTAPDGAAALEVAAAFEPEIVLLDIRMPVMDGYEAARRMRAEPYGKQAMLVALTGWGQQEHRHGRGSPASMRTSRSRSSTKRCRCCSRRCGCRNRWKNRKPELADGGRRRLTPAAGVPVDGRANRVDFGRGGRNGNPTAPPLAAGHAQ